MYKFTDEEMHLLSTVNEKMDVMSIFLNGIRDKHLRGLIISGTPGSSKSHLTREILYGAPNTEPAYVRGHITPLEVYKILYDNRDENKICIFDDCDAVFNEGSSRDVLKGALDTDNIRQVNWNTSRVGHNYPNSFRFDGRIVIITNANMRKNVHVKAVLDRMHYYRIELSYEEKLVKIIEIMQNRDYIMDTKDFPEIIDWLRHHKDLIGEKLTFRIASKLMDLRNLSADKWKILARYSVLEETKQ
jgi:hypothetical protein